jgi:hypothetical protein
VTSFDDWFAMSSFVMDICDGDDRQDAASRRWAGEVYQQHGPLGLDALRALVVATRLKVAARALEILSGEVRSSGYEMLTARAEIVRQEKIWGAESAMVFLGRELYALTIVDSVAELGEIVQDEIIDREMKVWPVCAWHNTGLRIRVLDGRAAWWCEAGNHVERWMSTLARTLFMRQFACRPAGAKHQARTAPCRPGRAGPAIARPLTPAVATGRLPADSAALAR